MPVFSMIQKYIAVAVIAAVISMGFYIKTLNSRIDTLNKANGSLAFQNKQSVQTITDLNLEIEALRKETARINKLVISRDSELVKLRRTNRWIENELEAYLKQDAEARKWADTRVPIGVYDRVFDVPSPDGNN